MTNDETKRKKRKLRWQIKLLMLVIGIILYSFFIGTKGIFVKEYKITTNKIESGMHGLKILQFSDLHYGSSVNNKTVKDLVIKINETKPDIVIFTGDLIDERHKLTLDEKEFIISNLNDINAELGKYYVTGEEDFEEATSILNLSSFVNLNTSEQLVYLKSSSPIVLMGKDSLKTYFELNKGNPFFKILAIHNPNDINAYKNYDIDLAISGHTHGGGINIPKLKKLLIDGDYTKNYQKVNGTKLFINPGIGTSKVNIRLFNHPTIYLYRINKTSS